MPLHWVYPGNFQIKLYRSGWKNDRSFDRIVAVTGVVLPILVAVTFPPYLTQLKGDLPSKPTH